MPGEDGGPYAEIVRELESGSQVNADMLGRILSRVLIGSEEPLTQVDVASGTMLNRQVEIAPATVSRAVRHLQRKGMLTRGARQANPRGGRHIVPIVLDGSSWGTIGVHIGRRPLDPNQPVRPEPQPRGLGVIRVVITGLDREIVCGPVEREVDPSGSNLVDQIAGAVEELRGLVDLKILGVGVEIGGHVQDGVVIDAPASGLTKMPLGSEVAQRLKLPVVVENDTNVRANELIYRQHHKATDFVLVHVFDDGVGGAVVVDGRLFRGATSTAGEIGHLLVEAPDEKDPHNLCACGGRGHVNTVATPDSIVGRLESDDLHEAASKRDLAPLEAGGSNRLALTPEAVVFRRAGNALGRGLAAVATLVNPGRIFLMLPSVLADAPAGTAAFQYRAAVEATLGHAFPVPAEYVQGNRRLDVQPWDPDEMPTEGAVAAASCVLIDFIAALRGRPVLAVAPIPEP